MTPITRHRWIGAAIALLALLSLTPPAASAEPWKDWDVDLRGGWYAKEAEGPFIGGGALTSMGHQWYFNPNLEFAFGDEVDYLTVNGDVHYDFTRNGNLSFWAGGGLAIVDTDPDGPGDGSTDLGLNLLVGLGDRKGGVRPFGQFKVILSDETEFVVMGGVRF
jgi:hypothetical protein